MQKQFRDLGVEVDLDEEDGADEVLVWDVNGKSLEAFLACGTQWRAVIGTSALVWLGLDYGRIALVIDRFAGIVRGSKRQKAAAQRRRDTLFDDLRAMEDAALEAFAEAQP